MKTCRILLIFLSIILLVVSCTPKATPKFPPQSTEKTDLIKGFLGVRWLSHDDAFSQGDCNFNVGKMLNWGLIGLSTYTCYLETEEFGLIGSSQALTYYQEQYFMGTIMFDKKSLFEKLINDLYTKYGKPTNVFDKKDAWAQTMEYKYHWKIERVLIQVIFDPQEDKGSFSMIYIPIQTRIDRILSDKKKVDTWYDPLKIEDLYK
jgi:hypothetical protein